MAANPEELARLRSIFTGAEARVRQALTKALDQSGRKLEGEAKRRAPVKAGLLRGAIGYKVTDAPVLRVGILSAPQGDALVYARIQDLGGTVTGKPHLAIPISDKLKTKAGVGAIRARDVIASPAIAGAIETFWGRSRAGNTILFGKDGTNDKDPEPLFVLKPSVSIPGSRYLTGAVEDNLPVVSDFIVRQVAKVVFAGTRS